MAKIEYNPRYEGCVLLNFEDHNYYDDSDSWTVYYDPRKKEIIEEFWTTRGYCPSGNADPKDFPYDLTFCPQELMDEVIKFLRDDVRGQIDFKKMAEQAFPAKYKYQEESAKQCQKEFLDNAQEVFEQFDDVWRLCYLSKKVHTSTDFLYRIEKYSKKAPLREQIIRRVKSKMVPVRKRKKAVYGELFEGIVMARYFNPSSYYNRFSSHTLIVKVEGYEKPMSVKLTNCDEAIKKDTKITFAGIISEGEKYNYINKPRIINEDDEIVWH